jgi:hypothetical protein
LSIGFTFPRFDGLGFDAARLETGFFFSGMWHPLSGFLGYSAAAIAPENLRSLAQTTRGVCVEISAFKDVL